MEIIITALALGFMGSFHCAGMCGPIALSLPLRGNNTFQKILGGMLYNFGRTLTYGIMGAFFGLIGQGFHMVGFQRWVSIAMGILMVFSVITPVFFSKLNLGNFEFITSKIRKAIQLLFQKKSFGGLFFIGLLNGLLPCGLVYLAIAGSIGTADFYLGVLFMILFGLGTIPMMLFISIAGNMMTLTIRNQINKAIPYLVVVIGLIFILRGLGLGIPFVSPPIEKMNPEVHLHQENTKDAVKKSCCHPDEHNN